MPPPTFLINRNQGNGRRRSRDSLVLCLSFCFLCGTCHFSHNLVPARAVAQGKIPTASVGRSKARETKKKHLNTESPCEGSRTLDKTTSATSWSVAQAERGYSHGSGTFAHCGQHEAILRLFTSLRGPTSVPSRQHVLARQVKVQQQRHVKTLRQRPAKVLHSGSSGTRGIRGTPVQLTPSSGRPRSDS